MVPRESEDPQEVVVSPVEMDPLDLRARAVILDQQDVWDPRVAKETQVPPASPGEAACEDLVDSLVPLAKQVAQVSVALPALTESPETKEHKVFKVCPVRWVFLEHEDQLVNKARKVLLVKQVPLDPEVTLVRMAPLEASASQVPSVPLVNVVLLDLLAHEVSKVFLVLQAVTAPLVRTVSLVCKVLEVFPVVPVCEAPEVSQVSEELKVHQERLAHEENLVCLVLTVLQVPLVHLARRATPDHLV